MQALGQLSPSPSSYLVLSLSIVALIVAYRPVLRAVTPKGIPGIPTLGTPSPIIGDFYRFLTLLKELGGTGPFFQYCYDRGGRIVQIRIFSKVLLVVHDPAIVDAVLHDRSAAFDIAASSQEGLALILPKGMVALNTGPMWTRHRRDKAGRCRLAWPNGYRDETGKGRAWEAEHDFEIATHDAITSIVFGKPWGNLTLSRQQVASQTPTLGLHGEAVFPRYRTAITDSLLYIFNTLPYASPVRRLAFFLLQLRPTWWRHRRALDRYVDGTVADAITHAQTIGAEKAWVDADNTLAMMVARGSEGKDSMTRDEMRDELLTYIIGGVETTSTALAWWSKSMASHPDVQHKLRAHLAAACPSLGQRDLEAADVHPDKTPYLEAVVHETLRYSKISTGFARSCMKDTTVAGYPVPKGSIIIFSQHLGYLEADELDSAGGDDPSEKGGVKAPPKWKGWKKGTGATFDPERWLDEDGRFDGNAGLSMPFGGGPRGCFGKALALLELRLAIAILSHEFFFANPGTGLDSEQLVEKVTRHPVQCYVRPVPWSEVAQHT